MARRLRIAFDVDETLIPYGHEFPVERSALGPILAPFFRESLREGALALLKDLAARGCDIWIYTTSARSSSYFRVWFQLLGVRLGGVVNCHRHQSVVLAPAARHPSCSKYPPAFGIDLLVDNSEGVSLEGLRYGFDVLLVAPGDREWAARVREAVRRRQSDASEV